MMFIHKYKDFITLCAIMALVSFRLFDNHLSGLGQDWLSRRRKYIFMVIELILLETIVVVIMVSTALSTLPNSADDISERINVVSSNLAEASEELSILQQALESRIEFVEDLKKQAEIAENVISLSEDQVNAVQTQLSRELNANSAKDMLFSIVNNAFFFVLGILLPLVIKRFKYKKVKIINYQLSEFELYTKADMLKILDAAKKSIEETESNSK